jgi:glycosyltransferase involved in cell wall biosynthesis
LLGRDERGLLVEPGDSASLAAALLRLLGDSELVRRYGEAARRHVEQHYAFSSVMRRHIELYTELAESC